MNTEERVAPAGSTTLCPYLMIPSVESQMEFLVKAFDARITNETRDSSGLIQHGEIIIGDTNVMMGRSSEKYPPRHSMCFVYVANVDDLHARMLALGADEIMAPDNRPYGMRESGLKDFFGNEWWIAQRLK